MLLDGGYEDIWRNSRTFSAGNIKSVKRKARLELHTRECRENNPSKWLFGNEEKCRKIAGTICLISLERENCPNDPAFKW